MSRERGPEGPIEVPVWRAAFTSSAGKTHEMLTVIEAMPHGGVENTSAFKNLDDRGIELRQEESVVRLIPHPQDLSSESLFGFATDGTLLLVVIEKGRPVAAGAFVATRLEGPDCSIRGDGFLSWTTSDSGTNR